MTYQLEALERWTRNDIVPEILLKDFSGPKIEAHIEFATRERDRICSFFRDKTIKGDSPSPIDKLVQAHQFGLNAIVDSIAKYGKSKDIELPKEMASFYIRICQTIEEINTFLQQHLREFINEDVPVSDISAVQSKKDLRGQLDTLKPLSENPAMDKKLFRMITRPFREFMDEGKSITLRELAYLKELIVVLRRLLDEDHDDIIYEVHLTLLLMNFNYPRYVLYYNYWLDEKLAMISGRMERLDRLSRHINDIEQVRFRPGCILIPGLPSVTEQLLVSIKNTYRYLLEKDQRVDHVIVNQIGRENAKRNDKINLALSVPVLALFLKALIKAGIIVNENKAEVFRTMAENFSTIKADSISYDSLKGKYNKTPPSAHIHLRKTLTKILETMRDI